MAAVSSQSLSSAALTTPTPITPTASDTIAEGQFGSVGCILRVITTGTLTNISVSDPGVTTLGNAGTVVALATPASGTRMLFIPRAAINPTTGVATVAFSGALTGITYELYRV
jgi:hypothetical protein